MHTSCPCNAKCFVAFEEYCGIVILGVGEMIMWLGRTLEKMTMEIDCGCLQRMVNRLQFPVDQLIFVMDPVV